MKAPIKLNLVDRLYLSDIQVKKEIVFVKSFNVALNSKRKALDYWNLINDFFIENSADWKQKLENFVVMERLQCLVESLVLQLWFRDTLPRLRLCIVSCIDML